MDIITENVKYEKFSYFVNLEWRKDNIALHKQEFSHSLDCKLHHYQQHKWSCPHHSKNWHLDYEKLFIYDKSMFYLSQHDERFVCCQKVIITWARRSLIPRWVWWRIRYVSAWRFEHAASIVTLTSASLTISYLVRSKWEDDADGGKLSFRQEDLWCSCLIQLSVIYQWQFSGAELFLIFIRQLLLGRYKPGWVFFSIYCFYQNIVMTNNNTETNTKKREHDVCSLQQPKAMWVV